MDDLKIRAVEQPFAGSLLVVPNDNKPHPGIVLLHGSEGGSVASWKLGAMRWAAEGFAALAFCYFGDKDWLAGTKQTLANIEINNIVQAITWLKSSSYVQNFKVALEGGSRGAELSLLTASLLGKEQNLIHAVSGHSCADTIWGPWNYDWIDHRCWLGETPLIDSNIRNANSKYIWNQACGHDPRKLPNELTYAWKWHGKPLFEGEKIPVHQIGCPVFISHGLNDNLWPADQSKRIEKELIDNQIVHEAHYYENEGHGLGLDAAYDRNKKLLHFLKKHLS